MNFSLYCLKYVPPVSRLTSEIKNFGKCVDKYQLFWKLKNFNHIIFWVIWIVGAQFSNLILHEDDKLHQICFPGDVPDFNNTLSTCS